MGITDDIGDSVFKAGQLVDAKDLGDTYSPDWIPSFQRQIHGVVIVAGDSQESVDKLLREATSILQLSPLHSTCHEIVRLQGTVRPGNQKGREQYVIQTHIWQPARGDRLINFTKLWVRRWYLKPGHRTYRQKSVPWPRVRTPRHRFTWAQRGRRSRAKTDLGAGWQFPRLPLPLPACP